MGFTWKAISPILNVSGKTPRRRRQEFDMPSFRNKFSDSKIRKKDRDWIYQKQRTEDIKRETKGLYQ